MALPLLGLARFGSSVTRAFGSLVRFGIRSNINGADSRHEAIRGVQSFLGGIQIKIHGAREILEAMQALPARFDRPLLNKSLLVGARIIRDEARRLAPVLQSPDARRVRGALKRAIHAGVVRPEQYTATTWVRVRKLTTRQVAAFKKRTGNSGASNPLDAFYWVFVEFGTSKMAARPFLRPAFEKCKEQAVAATIRDLRPRVQGEIEKLGRRRGAHLPRSFN